MKKQNQHRSATEYDVQIGKAIRSQRRLLGLSQVDLAAAIGVTYQQLQKYEKGINRVSAVTLFELADALNFSVLDMAPTRFRVGRKRR